MNAMYAQDAMHTQHVVNPAPLLNAPRLRPLGLVQSQSVKTSGRRFARPPRYQQVQASLADQDVKTDDKFRFSHSSSTNTFEVKGDMNKVFRYAADFSHIDRWDSG